MSLGRVGSGLINIIVCWSLLDSGKDILLMLAHIKFSAVSMRGLAKVVTLQIPGGGFSLSLISGLGQILIVHHLLVNSIVSDKVKLLHHLAIQLNCASDVVAMLLRVGRLLMRVVIVHVLVVGQIGGLVGKVLLQKIPVFFLWRVDEP
jgi:hypothetical protein